MLTYKYECENSTPYDTTDLVAVVTKVLTFVDDLSAKSGAPEPILIDTLSVETVEPPYPKQLAVYKLKGRKKVTCTIKLALPSPRNIFGSDLESIVGMTKGEVPEDILDDWAEALCRWHSDWNTYARSAYVAHLDEAKVLALYDEDGTKPATGWRSGRMSSKIYTKLLRQSLRHETAGLRIRFTVGQT